VCLLCFVVESDIYIYWCVYSREFPALCRFEGGQNCLVARKLSVGEANRYCLVVCFGGCYCLVKFWSETSRGGFKRMRRLVRASNIAFKFIFILASSILLGMQLGCGAYHVQKNTCLARRIAEELQIVD